MNRPSRWELLKLAFKQRGDRVEDNRWMPRRKWIAMFLKLAISLLIDRRGFPCAFDFMEDGYAMAYFGCAQVNHYFDPEEWDCNYLYVHDGWRHWVAGIMWL